MRLIRELVKSFLWQLVDQEAGQLVDKETSESIPHFRCGDSDSDDGDGDSMMVIETIFWSIRKSRYQSFTPGKVMVAMCSNYRVTQKISLLEFLEVVLNGFKCPNGLKWS